MANCLQQPADRIPASGFVSEERTRSRLAEQQRTVRERQKQSLNLQRENILSQSTSQPGPPRRPGGRAGPDRERRSRRWARGRGSSFQGRAASGAKARVSFLGFGRLKSALLQSRVKARESLACAPAPAVSYRHSVLPVYQQRRWPVHRQQDARDIHMRRPAHAQDRIGHVFRRQRRYALVDFGGSLRIAVKAHQAEVGLHHARDRCWSPAPAFPAHLGAGRR